MSSDIDKKRLFWILILIFFFFGNLILLTVLLLSPRPSRRQATAPVSQPAAPAGR